MINNTHDIFDLELKQHKFVEEENKNSVSTRVGVRRICTKV